jgi:NADPH-dependent 7-cyano-7-deazaguanine reductase QueF-like protein
MKKSEWKIKADKTRISVARVRIKSKATITKKEFKQFLKSWNQLNREHHDMTKSLSRILRLCAQRFTAYNGQRQVLLSALESLYQATFRYHSLRHEVEKTKGRIRGK